MMSRLALTNAPPGQKDHGDESGVVDFITNKKKSSAEGASDCYRFPNDEMKQKLKESNLNNAKTGDILVYYLRDKYEQREAFIFQHAAVVIDVKELNGEKHIATMGSSALYEANDTEKKVVGGNGPRSSHIGEKHVRCEKQEPPCIVNPKGFKYIQREEHVRKTFSSTGVIYQSVKDLNNEKLKIVFLWQKST